MPRIAYVDKRFQEKSLVIIGLANEIITEYMDAGYKLTLRQLYYQFVARGYLDNNLREYSRLGTVVNNGRLRGYIDWNAIEDRTRNLQSLSHWSSPQSIINSARYGYHIDMWEGQEYRPEVWVEKEALAGVFGKVCDKWDIPLFSCRGYSSQSEMWAASQRMLQHEERGQTPIIFHFGDHDPSGMDMSRDIRDRLEMFGCSLDFNRLALNMDQITEKIPPNPAKLSDSRCQKYIQLYGPESWELDALEPAVLAKLTEDFVKQYVDDDKWQEKKEEKQEGIDMLANLADYYGEIAANWDMVESFLDENRKGGL